MVNVILKVDTAYSLIPGHPVDVNIDPVGSVCPGVLYYLCQNYPLNI